MELIRIKTGARSRLARRLPELADECGAILTYLDGNHELSDIAERSGICQSRVEWLISAMHDARLLDIHQSAIQIADRHHSKVRARALKNSHSAPDAIFELIQRKMKPELTLLTWREGVDDGGVAMLNQRQEYEVEISGLSRLIAPVASILVASGVTSTRISPAERVGRESIEVEDLTGHFLDLSDVGSHYFSRVTEKLKSFSLFSERRASTEEVAPFLRVFFGAPSDQQRAIWEQRGENYLVIASPEAALARIGPLVLVDKSPCARCAELTLAGETTSSEQLSGYDIPVAQTHYLAGLIADQILRFIDTGRCEVLGAIITIDFLNPCIYTRSELARHPMCGCAFR